MKICGILNWFDESPAWLATCVASMGRFCDEIVAVDGAYMLLPGARPRSLPEQADAIVAAADAAEVGLTLHRPADIFWGNEVEKRNLTLRLAGTVIGEDDWVVIVDADQYLMRLNRAVLRHELETTDRYVANYTVLDGRDVLSDPALAHFAIHRELATEWTSRTHCCYRWHPTLRYGPLHWSVSREVDGTRRWLWAPSDNEILPALNLDASLVFYHRTEDRAQVRRDVQDGYYKAREAAAVEKWVVPETNHDNVRGGQEWQKASKT